ncbi:MAG TPA: hypothetical protein PLR98_08965, partial [Chitinophagaceae bacterium]|nr:hypothetical protein [Chitinophagaceae bacterium]
SLNDKNNKAMIAISSSKKYLPRSLYTLCFTDVLSSSFEDVEIRKTTTQTTSTAAKKEIMAADF